MIKTKSLVSMEIYHMEFMKALFNETRNKQRFVVTITNHLLQVYKIYTCVLLTRRPESK